MKIYNALLVLIFVYIISGCATKPLQPGPAEYNMWIQKGIDETQVKSDVLECGYPNIYGYAGIRASSEEKAAAQQCMFMKGYKLADGWVGICAEPNRKVPLVACGETVEKK